MYWRIETRVTREQKQINTYTKDYIYIYIDILYSKQRTFYKTKDTKKSNKKWQQTDY